MKAAFALLLVLSLPAFAADKPASPNPDTAQPAAESLDLATIARIRDEGMNHSRIMEYASGLFDGIGPRLTGSPDFAKAATWAQTQLKIMGAS
ncbi:MAG: peptidase M28, partial [Terracidiphilus sp.]